MRSQWLKKFLTRTNAKHSVPSSTRCRLQLSTLEDRTVPSTTLYVDPTLAGSTPGSTVTFDSGKPDQVTGLVFGTNAFSSISSAVSTAQAGSTIQLASQTFMLTPGTLITQSVNIVGAGEGKTILEPSTSVTTGSGDASALFAANTAGTTVNFSNFTINGLGTTTSLEYGILYDSTVTGGTVQNVQFANIINSGTNDFSAPADDGVGVGVLGGTVNVISSSFTNMGQIGVLFQGPNPATTPVTTGSVQGSTFVGKGASTVNIDYGVEIDFSATNILVTGNTFSNMTGTDAAGDTSAAIFVADSGSSAMIIGNQIQNNLYGVLSGFSTSDTLTVSVNYNNFVGNTGAAIANNSASSLNAFNNYYGSTSGPNYPLQNPGGTGNGIVNQGSGVTQILTPSGQPNFLRTLTPVLVATSTSAYIAAAAAIAQPAVVAIGAGEGGGPQVIVQQSGKTINSFYAFESNFTGGVSVAVGDLTGTGVQDVVVGAGATGGPRVAVYDARTGTMIMSFYAYSSTFTGGITVAVGDVMGTGYDDIITAADFGGGPNIKVFDGKTGALVSSFYAYDPSFTGGVYIAAGDVYGTGKDYIITGAGFSGGPNVKVFTGAGAQLLSYYAYASGFTGGVKVAAGDISGTGIADIITYANTTQDVRVYGQTGNEINGIYTIPATPTTPLTGVNITAKDYNGTGKANLLVAAGPNQAPTLTVLSLATSPATTVSTESSLFPFDLPGGIFVG